MSENVKIGEWEQKVWGETKCSFFDQQWSNHDLRTNAGGFCSVHYHLERNNLFRVKSGWLKVVWCFAWRMHSRVLGSGEYLAIASCIPHQFQCITDCRLVEEYHPDRPACNLDINDIERLTIGGVVDLGDDERAVIFESGDHFYDQQGRQIKCWNNAL